ncbi:MAG: hypothetical protein J6R94_00835, partial [Agathobacter sp.]|nr:hypothetical protein [Agathobacter sp.]
MFQSISILLLVIELALLAWCIISKNQQKRRKEKFLYLALVFVITLTLQVVPYLYKVAMQSYDANYILELLSCVIDAIKMFIGDIEIKNQIDMAQEIPVFAVTYLFGVILALHFTISTALEFFRHSIRNYFRIMSAMNRGVCDIVVGKGEKALTYAKDHAAVLLLSPDDVDKDTAINLMKSGYMVLRREFNQRLLESNLFDEKNEYNIICLKDSCNGLDMVYQFLPITRVLKNKRNKIRIHMYVELENRQLELVCRDKITSEQAQMFITPFRVDDILARTFAHEYPITRYLPKEFVAEDASIREDKKLNIVFLGFGGRSQEIFRQCVMNNQLVCYKND